MDKELMKITINSLERQIKLTSGCHQEVLPLLVKDMNDNIYWMRKILNEDVLVKDKSCDNCKYREYHISVAPCPDCDDEPSCWEQDLD